MFLNHTQSRSDTNQRAFWGTFGRPMAKVFTGAMVTYQICYWSWLKLETMELERTNDGMRIVLRCMYPADTLAAEIHRLEARLRQLQDRLGKLDSTAK